MSTPNQPPWPQQPGQPGSGGQPPLGQPPYGGPQGQPQGAPWTPRPGQPPYGQAQGGQPGTGQPQPGFAPPDYGGQQRPGSYPTPPSGYPNQPGGPGGYPPQPGQPGVGGPGGAMPPQGKKGSSRIFVMVGVIVLALIIVGVGAAVLVNRSTQTTTSPVDPTTTGGPGGSAPPTGGSSAPPPASTEADQAVKAYLEALAAGNAAVALSLGKDQPTDKTFLTDDVLAESNKRAPITEITVSSPDSEYDSSIEASYKMGDQQVNETFTVQKQGENFLLDDITQVVNLETIRSRTLPMQINGVGVTSDKVDLFPGSYVLTSGSDYIAYGGGPMVITSPNDYGSAYDHRPAITAAGTKAVIAAAKNKLAGCAKAAKLKPSGCPFLNIRENPGQNVAESSVRRRIVGNPFANVEPRTDYQDPSVAEFNITVRWTATASGTERGQRARFTIDNATDFTTVRARLTNDPIRVVFGR